MLLPAINGHIYRDQKVHALYFVLRLQFLQLKKKLKRKCSVCERVHVQKRGCVHACANGKLNHGALSSSQPGELPQRTEQLIHRPMRLHIVWCDLCFL